VLQLHSDGAAAEQSQLQAVFHPYADMGRTYSKQCDTHCVGGVDSSLAVTHVEQCQPDHAENCRQRPCEQLRDVSITTTQPNVRLLAASQAYKLVVGVTIYSCISVIT